MQQPRIVQKISVFLLQQKHCQKTLPGDKFSNMLAHQLVILMVLGLFMMMVYSLILCFMPQNGCCIFKVGPREPWGPLLGFFKVSLPQCLRVWCSLGFAWLAWGFFISPGWNLGFFSFLWAWRGHSSNPSAAFRGELYGLVLVRDQREQAAGEEREGLSVSAPDLGQSSSQGGHTCFTSGEGTNTRHCLGSHLLAWLLHEPFGFLPWDRGAGAIFLPTWLPAVVGFYLSLAFWFFFPGGRREGVECVLRSDSSISSIYLPFFPCCVGSLFVNKQLGFFCTFIH